MFRRTKMNKRKEKRTVMIMKEKFSDAIYSKDVNGNWFVSVLQVLSALDIW